MFIKDLTFEANCTILIFLSSLFRLMKDYPERAVISLFIYEKSMLERVMVISKKSIIILFRYTKFLGVFLSPNAFLKSLMILLKE